MTTGAFHLPSADPEAIPWDEALAAALGYARGQRDLCIKTPSYPDGHTVRVPAFAYRVYDCMPASEDDGFAWLDVLVVDGLNGKLNHDAITALKDAGERAWRYVSTADKLAGAAPFWELPPEELMISPPSGGPGEAMRNAREEFRGTKGIGLALAHKVLHHKRPRLFPLLDRQTAPQLWNQTREEVGVGWWTVIHRELLDNDQQFTELERVFAELVDGPDDVPLSRLRLHDVLLWLKATGKWGRAVDAGRACSEWEQWVDTGRS